MKQTTGPERYALRQAAKRAAEEREQKRIEYFMKKAIAQAKAAERRGEVPIGAVIVKDGKVIARAFNSREGKRLATAHAEILAIERACKRLGDWRLNGCEMFVTLEPCFMCAGAVANARLSKVYFGASEPKGGACGSVFNVPERTGLNSYTVVVGGVLGEECSALITDFFENKRNKMKI